jgi:hypothetical protein
MQSRREVGGIDPTMRGIHHDRASGFRSNARDAVSYDDPARVTAGAVERIWRRRLDCHLAWAFGHCERCGAIRSELPCGAVVSQVLPRMGPIRLSYDIRAGEALEQSYKTISN